MKCPIRSLTIFVSAFCLSLCSFAYSGNPVKGASPSDQPNPGRAKAGTPSSSPRVETATIPGPLRSFMRMAAISQKVPSEDVLPLLARNVFMQGYQRGTPTEFLLLLGRYIQQARELQILAGDSYTIRVCSQSALLSPSRSPGLRLQAG